MDRDVETADVLMQWHDCTGTITHGQRSWDVRCSVRYTSSGVIAFEFDDMQFNEHSFELYQIALSDDEPLVEFANFDGTSADGAALRSSTLYFSQAGAHTDRQSSVVRIAGEAVALDVTIAPDIRVMPGGLAVARYHTAGMQGFGALTRQVGEGTLRISAAPEAENVKGATGMILLEAACPQRLSDWLTGCDALVTDVLRIISFAQGRKICWTTCEVWVDNRLQSMRFVNQGTPGDGVERTFDHLNMDPVIDLGLAYHARSAESRERLRVAIEWLLVPSTYAEMRFLAAVTAFEHLLGSEPSIGSVLEPSVFKNAVRAPLESVLRGSAVTARLMESSGGCDPRSIDTILTRMADSLHVLNSRPRGDRLTDFIDRYGVPVADVPMPIDKLWQMRNKLVHGVGVERGNPRASLTLQAGMIREILRRTILALLDFDGQFYSYVRGPEWLTFRAPPTVEAR